MRVSLLVLLFVVAASPVLAAKAAVGDEGISSRPQVVVVDGKPYTRGEIIQDFLRVAFSDRLWNEDAGRDFDELFDYFVRGYPASIERGEDYDVLNAEVPWLTKHLYPWNDLPSSGTLHKWPAEISIGIDWPRYRLEGGASANSLNPYSFEGVDAFYPRLARVVTDDVISLLDSSLPVSIRLIAPDDSADRSADYARIRIVPSFAWDGRTWEQAPKYIWRPSDYEERLWGGVLFQSADRALLDGYLLPNPDDQLDLAICKINVKNATTEQIDSLAIECVLRSLGFPGTPQLASNSALGGAQRSDTTAQRKQGISEYDRLLVTLMYCSDIRSGMTKHDVIRVLATADGCFGSYLKH